MNSQQITRRSLFKTLFASTVGVALTGVSRNSEAMAGSPTNRGRVAHAANGPIYAGQQSFLRRPYTRRLRKADIAIMGNPYDAATTNRPGTRFGPRALREWSLLVGVYPWGVWPWDFNLVKKHKIIDYGDVTGKIGYLDSMLEKLEKEATRITNAGVSLLTLGGDHLTSLPVLRALAKKYGPLSLIQFDAHSDAWKIDTQINHATMFYHAAKENLVDPSRSVQVYIRTPNPETHGYNVIHADKAFSMGPQKVAHKIRQIVGENSAYLTFDIDCLDPAYAPGTGTPVCGGPTSNEVREVLKGLTGLNIVAGDQVEVSPPYDPTGQVTALAGATIAIDILYLISIARG